MTNGTTGADLWLVEVSVMLRLIYTYWSSLLHATDGFQTFLNMSGLPALLLTPSHTLEWVSEPQSGALCFVGSHKRNYMIVVFVCSWQSPRNIWKTVSLFFGIFVLSMSFIELGGCLFLFLLSSHAFHFFSSVPPSSTVGAFPIHRKRFNLLSQDVI